MRPACDATGTCTLIRRPHAAHLVHLLRPEFVRSQRQPLSSDAFSGFARHDPDFSAHNGRVVEVGP